MSEEAKAAQEIAKASSKAIDAASELGAFGKQVFGDLLINGVGVLSDKLKYYRLEKAVLLEEKVRKRLKDKGIENTEAVSPKIGLPLIEQATLEGDDRLHTKWANMLSNAMDPKYKDKIKRNFVSILTDMEPVDVFILDAIAKAYLSLTPQQQRETLFVRDRLSAELKITTDQCEVALRNLIRLGCLKPGVVVSSGINLGGHNATAYKDTEMVGITTLGLEFYKAVN